MMIRTQVYLTEQQAQEIKLTSRREKKPLAKIIRELVDEGLKMKNKTPKETTGESLLRLAKIGGKGPADLSQRIDDYLYGDDK